MHGLINRSIEEYLRARYGEQVWCCAARAAEVDERGFQAVGSYPDPITLIMADAAAGHLGIARLDLFDDMGAWLAQTEPLRRLLRFSGSNYADFVLDLDQLRARAHMIVPDLGIPEIIVAADGADRFCITMPDGSPAWRCVLSGLLRQMADDFGVLALISVEPDCVRLDIPEHSFAEGRPFSLAAPASGVGR